MVKLENVKKHYDKFDLNISMDIPRGTIVGLIGKNGSGKSTTIKAMLGLIKPDSGCVSVFGKAAGELTVEDKCDLGIALTSGGYSGYLTIKDIVAIQAKLYKNFDAGDFLRKCSKAGLPDDKATKEFSTGMKAKLRVLLALSHSAKLLIMDEPTAGLDVGARQEILDILREYMLEDEERSILITSHIATDLEGLCDDIYLIDNGQIILHEDINSILENYGVIKVDKEAFDTLDKAYILKSKDESFGRVCITNQRQYYMENYPDIVVEKGGIDELILILAGGR